MRNRIQCQLSMNNNNFGKSSIKVHENEVKMFCPNICLSRMDWLVYEETLNWNQQVRLDLDTVLNQSFTLLEVGKIQQHKNSRLVCPCNHQISKSWADLLSLWSWFYQDLLSDKLTFQASVSQKSKVWVESKILDNELKSQANCFLFRYSCR